MEPKVANIRQGLVSAGLGLQPAENLGWMGLLDEPDRSFGCKFTFYIF